MLYRVDRYNYRYYYGANLVYSGGASLVLMSLMSIITAMTAAPFPCGSGDVDLVPDSMPYTLTWMRLILHSQKGLFSMKKRFCSVLLSFRVCCPSPHFLPSAHAEEIETDVPVTYLEEVVTDIPVTCSNFVAGVVIWRRTAAVCLPLLCNFLLIPGLNRIIFIELQWVGERLNVILPGFGWGKAY